MFQELMPLLLQRVLILTLSRVGDEEICVNVIPNQVLAYQALAMLSRLFRYGRLSHQGGFVNLRTGRTPSLPVECEGADYRLQRLVS